MDEPAVVSPQLQPYQLEAIRILSQMKPGTPVFRFDSLPPLQFGKSMMVERMARAAEEAGHAVYRFGEKLRGHKLDFFAFDDLAPLPDIDHDGGRTQKPPVAEKREKLPPGHVWMRDRTGKMVMRKLGK